MRNNETCSLKFTYNLTNSNWIEFFTSNTVSSLYFMALFVILHTGLTTGKCDKIIINSSVCVVESHQSRLHEIKKKLYIALL